MASDGSVLGAIIVYGGVFAVGGVFAHVISEKRLDEALEWAVDQTAQCERTYLEEGFDSVSECLQYAVSAAQEERDEIQHEPI